MATELRMGRIYRLPSRTAAFRDRYFVAGARDEWRVGIDLYTLEEWATNAEPVYTVDADGDSLIRLRGCVLAEEATDLVDTGNDFLPMYLAT